MPKAKITPEQAEAIFTKIDAGEKLTAAELAKLPPLLCSLAATVAVQDAQIGELGLTIEILESEEAATKASRSAALSALRIIAPPATAVNVDQALAQAETLRKKVADSTSFTQMAIAATRFAVGVTSKFI
jgi:hypothetical protein